MPLFLTGSIYRENMMCPFKDYGDRRMEDNGLQSSIIKTPGLSPTEILHPRLNITKHILTKTNHLKT